MDLRYDSKRRGEMTFFCGSSTQLSVGEAIKFINAEILPSDEPLI